MANTFNPPTDLYIYHLPSAPSWLKYLTFNPLEDELPGIDGILGDFVEINPVIPTKFTISFAPSPIERLTFYDYFIQIISKRLSISVDVLESLIATHLSIKKAWHEGGNLDETKLFYQRADEEVILSIAQYFTWINIKGKKKEEKAFLKLLEILPGNYKSYESLKKYSFKEDIQPVTKFLNNTGSEKITLAEMIDLLENPKKMRGHKITEELGL